MQEVWRAAPGYVGYEVSTLGRVRCWKTPGGYARERPRLNKIGLRRGYPIVCIARPGERQRPVCVHKLVLLAFLGEPSGSRTQARHLNGEKADNRVANLRWGTPKENCRDRDRHGRTARGERSGAHTQPHRRARGDRQGRRLYPERYPVGERVNTAKLVPEQVRAIRAAEGKVRDLAVQFGISKSMVSYIRRGDNWRHVV